MVRLIFRLLTPLLFFLAVLMFLSDFRLVTIAFAAAGCVSYLIAEELKRAADV